MTKWKVKGMNEKLKGRGKRKWKIKTNQEIKNKKIDI